jgi:hypothetical protein
VRGNIISSNDPRYAWVPFYFRDTDITGNTQPYAQLILICVQATNASTFVDADVNPTPATNWANLRGRPVAIKVANGDDTLGDPDLIGFEDSQLNATTILPGAVSAVAEGCFVIVRADTGNGGRLTGQVYRVGARRPEKDGQTVNSYSDLTTDPPKTVNFTGMQVWELAPGNDFQIVRDLYQNPPVVYAIDQPTEAWIMGRSFASPNYTGAAPTFDGPAMDVSFYSTFVFCKP